MNNIKILPLQIRISLKLVEFVDHDLTPSPCIDRDIPKTIFMTCGCIAHDEIRLQLIVTAENGLEIIPITIIIVIILARSCVCPRRLFFTTEKVVEGREHVIFHT